MKRIVLAIFALTLSVASAIAQTAMFPVPSIQISITGTVATITRIVAATTGKQIVVTAINQVPVATSVVTYSYGTGTNCASGTTALTGALTFAAGQTINMGDGTGPVMIVPQNNDLCVTIATAAAPGALVYTLVP